MSIVCCSILSYFWRYGRGKLCSESFALRCTVWRGVTRRRPKSNPFRDLSGHRGPIAEFQIFKYLFWNLHVVIHRET